VRIVTTRSHSVLAEVQRERERQAVELGYAVDHDDAHAPAAWIALLARYVGRAGDAGESGDRYAYRRRLVQVAAIATAAVESLDRVVPP
jgi:hypothetical protein